MKPKILITDPVHELLPAGLEGLGFEVVYKPETSFQQVLEEIGQYTGLIINSKVAANVQLMDKGERLRFVGRLGSGLDVIDTGYADKKGIRYFNSPEGNCNAVAEHALGMLLGLMNNIPVATEETRKGLWLREQNRGNELGELTVGIVGYGHTGKAFARLLSGFGCRVLAFDKYIFGFSGGHVQEASMEALFNEADIVSMHVQLTDETRYLVNRDFLGRFKKPVWFVNTSRGKVVKTVDLLDAIDQGKVKGAALDVLENEKPDTFTKQEEEVYQRLVNNPAVMLTPHIAGWTHQSKRKIAEVVLKKIEDLMKTIDK